MDSLISSEHHEKEKRLSVHVARDIISSVDLKLIESDINLLKNQEHLDVSMSDHIPGLTSSKTVDDKGDPAVQPVQKDSQLLDHLDLYAPDTMDPFVDSEIPKESTFIINEKLNSAEKSTCTVKDKINSPGISVSEKCVAESQLKDDMVIADNSEKSDSDPAGQVIDSSMMALLLPQAFPLLKTFTRMKKHKKMNLQEERKGTDHGHKDQPPAKSLGQIQGEEPGADVHVSDKVYTENFKSEKQNENALFSSTCMSSAIPGSEDLTTVALDSFENDQCEVKECSQAGHVQVKLIKVL